jgi:hypothetical protein
MRFGTMVGSMAVLALVAAAAGCSDDETGPTGGHSPVVAARLVVNGAEIDDGETLTLTTGEAVEIEVRFLDEHGDVIEGIADHHYAKLNFTPAELAATADVADHHFRKTVTAQATTGTGTLSVGYGHDADADENSFGTFDVEVVAPPCVCGRGRADAELVFGNRNMVPLGG